MPPRVSLCLIVKNEEDNLPACLTPVADLVEEIILVDTGSTDRTREIAGRFRARIHHFPWRDDFAAARNQTLRHATGEWIFWLDADDRIDEVNRQRLRELFAGLHNENAAYIMTCVCTTAMGAGVALFDHVRLFRKQPGVRWEYRIHEQIRPTLERLKYSFHRSDVSILHIGYQDPALMRRKAERNLRLLQREEKDRRYDPHILFNLGLTCQELGRLPEALAYYRQSLPLAKDRRPVYLRKLYAMLAKVCRQLGQTGEAMTVCREGRALYPEDAELLTQEAWLLYLLGDFAGTEARLLHLLQGPAPPENDGNFSEDPGLRGHVTRHNLAVLYRDQRRLAEAEAQWRAVLTERPDMTDARLGLGELYLGQQRWRDLEEVLAQLQADPQGKVRAAVLLAQKHIAFQEFPAARRLMEEAIALDPRAGAAARAQPGASGGRRGPPGHRAGAARRAGRGPQQSRGAAEPRFPSAASVNGACPAVFFLRCVS